MSLLSILVAVIFIAIFLGGIAIGALVIFPRLSAHDTHHDDDTQPDRTLAALPPEERPK